MSIEKHKIFISYTRADGNEIVDYLEKGLNMLAKIDTWSDKKIPLGNKWYDTIVNALNESDLGVLLVSRAFFESKFIKKEELTRFIEKYASGTQRLIFVLVDDKDRFIKSAFGEIQAFPKKDRTLATLKDFGEQEEINKKLDELIESINGFIQNNNPLPFSYIHSKSDLTHLPKPSYENLIGRDNEISKIKEFFEDKDKIFTSIIASGGSGKSALTFKIIRDLEKNGFVTDNTKFEKIFAWSFYSQGTHTTYNDSTIFFKKAFEFFDFYQVIDRVIYDINGQYREKTIIPIYERLDKISKSIIDKIKSTNNENINKAIENENIKELQTLVIEHVLKNQGEKAKILASLVKQHNSLLILDGLEPLQNQEGIDGGSIVDRELRDFIQLSKTIESPKVTKVVISSRVTIKELQNDNKHVPIPLENLDITDGANLFLEIIDKEQKQLSPLEKDKNYDKNSKEYKIKTLSNELDGNPLSLVLLAKNLEERHNGNINYMDVMLTDIQKINSADGNQATRVIEYYLNYLNTELTEEEAKNINPKRTKKELELDNQRKREFLSILALFDKPMEKDILEYLLEKFVYAKNLQSLSEGDFSQLIIKNLKENSLIIHDKENEQYDTHPLIRNYFAKEFKDKEKENFSLGHQLLAERYETIPASINIAELDKLLLYYQALYHYALSENYKRAYSIYDKYIAKGDEFMSLRVYGLVSKNLFAFSCFFKDGWDTFYESVDDNIKKSIYGGATHHLMTLGDKKAVNIAKSDLKFRKEQYKKEQNQNNLNEIFDSFARLYDVLYFNGKLEDATKLTYEIDNYRGEAVSPFFNMVLRSRNANISQNYLFIKEYNKVKSDYKAVDRLKEKFINSFNVNNLKKHFKYYHDSYYQQDDMISFKEFQEILNEDNIDTDNIDREMFKKQYDKFFDNEIDISDFFKALHLDANKLKSKLTSSKDVFDKFKNRYFKDNTIIDNDIKHEIYYNKPHVIWEERRDSYLLDLMIYGVDDDKDITIIENRINSENLKYHIKANRVGYLSLNHKNLAKVDYIKGRDFKKNIELAISQAKASNKKDFELEAMITKAILLKLNNENIDILLSEIKEELKTSAHMACEIEYNILANNIDKANELIDTYRFYSKKGLIEVLK